MLQNQMLRQRQLHRVSRRFFSYAGQKHYFSYVKRVKPFTLHCSLLLLIFVYAFAGGMVFHWLEADATEEAQRRDNEQKSHCVAQALRSATTHHPHHVVHHRHHQQQQMQQNNATASGSQGYTVEEAILRCFRQEVDIRSQWSYVTATLYGFGIVTTLGYNRIAPITLAGRLFCVLYGIIGIPATMIIIANIGQYLNQFAGATRKNIEVYRERRRQARLSITGEDIDDTSIELMSLGLLLAFLCYIALGAVLLPLLNGEFDFYNGIYFNFLCLTAIDFGQLVPARVALLPITFLYVCIGLAITTIAIDIGSEYMKKLHYIGQKMKNVATTRIWFGGKTLRVKDLLHAVGKKCGVDPSEIDNLDLENVVERQIAINEGKPPPPDTNPEPEPPKVPTPPPSPPPQAPPSPPPPNPDRRLPPPPPSMFIRPPPPMYEEKRLTTRHRQPRFAKSEYLPPPPLQLCNFLVGGALTVEDLESPAALDPLEPSPSLYRGSLMEQPVDPAVANPDQLLVLGHDDVQVLDDSHRERGVPPDTPRNFEEKKERYATDAKRLYDTYREEWDRLERLSKERLGPRRKSVLNIPGAGEGVDEATIELGLGPGVSGVPTSRSHHQSLVSSLSRQHQPRTSVDRSSTERDSRPVSPRVPSPGVGGAPVSSTEQGTAAGASEPTKKKKRIVRRVPVVKKTETKSPSPGAGRVRSPSPIPESGTVVTNGRTNAPSSTASPEPPGGFTERRLSVRPPSQERRRSITPTSWPVEQQLKPSNIETRRPSVNTIKKLDMNRYKRFGDFGKSFRRKSGDPNNNEE